MHVKYKQDNFALYDMVHRYVWDNGHRLTIYVNFMVKCVYYIGLGSDGCFMASAALTTGHYRMNIISGVGHPRSDLVVPLVLCMVVYNIQGTDVILKVPRDNANLVGNG
jgi:hypothetical protein